MKQTEEKWNKQKKPYEATQDTESISKYPEDPKEHTMNSLQHKVLKVIETTTGTRTGYF